jgi:N-carbamoyl-L-amino-acid hydrolase
MSRSSSIHSGDGVLRRPSQYVRMDRLNDRLAVMSGYGATPKGGVNRQALTAEDLQAQLQLIRWGAELGMQPSSDSAGNLFLRCEGSDPSLAPVLSGSHLDSQPTGGKFDGVYGVLAALEAVNAMQDAGLNPRRSIEVVSWMNEEGSRFAPGMMGSTAYADPNSLSEMLLVKDAKGVSVREALSLIQDGLREIPCRPLGGHPHAYIEAHIEQGPLLEQQNAVVGVVSGIQGKRTFLVEIIGEATHAGTSPRSKRKDAILAAVRIIDALANRLHDGGDIVKFTVGRLIVEPNAPSVVANRVVFSIDLRHPESAELTLLGDLILPFCEINARPCSVSLTELSNATSFEFPDAIRDRIRSIASTLKIAHIDLLSAAGHDARHLHKVCPSGMIFVPSRDGITHNEAEYTSAEDLTDGARVLADVLGELST